MAVAENLRIWVLLDERAGNRSQSLGVAEAFGGLPFEKKEIIYTKEADWPNFLRGATLTGVDCLKSARLEAPWPHVVIAAGRRLTPVLRWIKKQSSGTLTVQLMWPGWPRGGVDLIAVPEHDGISPSKQVMVTIGAPHRVTPEALEQERKIWTSTLGQLPRPWISLLVGGATPKSSMSVEQAAELARYANQMAAQAGGSILLTTSRRTSEEATRAIVSALTVPSYQHLWSGKKVANPYVAYLALSDAIIVTGDSIAMCTEAAAANKPVLVYAPKTLTTPKHERFLKRLYGLDYALPIDPAKSFTFAQAQQAKKWAESEPLNPAASVAAVIAERLKIL